LDAEKEKRERKSKIFLNVNLENILDAEKEKRERKERKKREK
jgi:hypothetical protein